MVALELEVLAHKLDRFGWDRMSEAVKDRLISDWIEALQDYRLPEIRTAIRNLLSAGARNPNEQQVRQQIANDRAAELARFPRQLEVEPERERVSAEAAQAILAEAGFAPNRFGGDA